MKKQSIRKNMILAFAVILLAGFASQMTYAQRGAGKGMGRNSNPGGMCMNLPELSEEQKEKISEIRTDFMKETLELRNKIRVNRAELQMISTGDDVNMNDVDAKIDEIADLRAQMMKKHAAHRQQLRSLLNEEQQVMFDQHGPGFGMGMEHGKKSGKGRAYGKGMRGNGPGPFCPWQDDNE